MKLVFRAAAQREFTAAAKWYEEQSPGLGTRFQFAVEEAISRLSATPTSFAQSEKGVFEIRVTQFPYCVYYRVRGDQIVVLAVFHHARDPEVRKKRR
jgi:toxin ParE1/3/4